jgi:ABC-type multidrug transport system ATPase subunit
MDDILRLADKLLVFSQGKLVLEGTPTDVFKERTILAQAGLKPPELTLMMEELHEAGLAADSGARNLSEAAESIRQVCQKRTNVLK